MTVTDTATRSDRRTPTDRGIVVIMYAGLLMSLLATAVPYLDRVRTHTLVRHIEAGYPSYSAVRIDSAADIYLAYLTVVGALGIGCWLGAIRAVRRSRRWARELATAMFAIGTTIALVDLLIKDTSGDTGLSPLLGWSGLLPCAVGLVAVIALWRPRRARTGSI